jgi:hypothetical protein
MHFSHVLPDALTYRLGGLYRGKPLKILSREELVKTVAPRWQPYFKKLQAEPSELAALPAD